MLIKLSCEVAAGALTSIAKILYEDNCAGRRDVSHLGAFAASGVLEFRVALARRQGVTRVQLRIWRDGGAASNILFVFTSSLRGDDLYTASLNLRALAGEEGEGLFYYELVFFRGKNRLFTRATNNVDFTLAKEGDAPFRLLLFREDFKPSRIFGNKIIYHIFVDRFRRGAGEVSIREGSLLDENWEGGIPQYVERPGDHLENNVFFGGNLWGVVEKIDYLASLSVGVIYLSPIFESYSNHKYDTGDYLKVDSLFGGDAALDTLIAVAAERGISVILDGVFNHTGDDSLYFNKYGSYPALGAYQSKKSPYFNWYSFTDFPDSYECWWNIKILPKLNHQCAACREFFAGPGGVGAEYIRRGIAGWRLDVADELSDAFLEEFRESVRAAGEGAAQEPVIIGEVWENAADKVAYGHRRKYLRGRQLDSVMNYPLREAIVNFVLYRDGNMLYNILTDIYSSYPRRASDLLMNIVGTHDTERILTVLADAGTDTMSNRALAAFRLDKSQRAAALERLKLASVIQYTAYGIPSLYYGDEAGAEGGRDPFCRMPYPWGRQDPELLAHYRLLGEIRSRERVFAGGDFKILDFARSYILYERRRDGERVLIAANSGQTPIRRRLPGPMTDLLTGKKYLSQITIASMGAVILK